MYQDKAVEAVESFTHKHPIGVDDKKAPEFYKEIARHFNFNQQKIVFIVVAHMVHTLPYFLQALTQIGAIAAIIPKASKYVPDVEASLDDIYNPFICRDINKTILNTEPTKVQLFLQEMSKRYPDCQLMILDYLEGLKKSSGNSFCNNLHPGKRR